MTRVPHIATDPTLGHEGQDAGATSAPLNPRDQTLDRIAARRIRDDRLIPEGASLLAAVSGGSDSVALLAFLAAERSRTGRPAALAVGHVNHGLRGRDSNEDAAFVKRLAERLGLPYFEETLPPRALPREQIPGGSARGVETSERSKALAPEDRARRLRYEALGRIAREAGGTVIATAHTADDQAETVLFRMARGTGLKGLAGIPSRSRIFGLTVIRPLLDVSREQILAYLASGGLPHREDASNANLGAARNYIRHEVLPRLTSGVSRGARRALARQADLFRELDGYLQAEAWRVLPQVEVDREEGKIVLDAQRLVPYPKLLRTYIFRCALDALGGAGRDVSATHVGALHSLATQDRGRSVDLPMGVRGRRERGRIILTGRNQEPAVSDLHPTVETSGIPADSRKGSPAE